MSPPRSSDPCASNFDPSSIPARRANNEIYASLSFAGDVSKIGHWDVGDVELAVNSLDRLREAEAFVRKSFENAIRK